MLTFFYGAAGVHWVQKRAMQQSDLQSHWKVRRSGVESVTTIKDLRAKVASGNLKKEDYVFNPTFGTWLYAKDVMELTDLFEALDKVNQAKKRNAEAEAANAMGFRLGCSGLALILLGAAAFIPLAFVGLLLLLVGIGYSIAYYSMREK